MKANRVFLQRMGDRAEVGVGTLIIFIAAVLVAAVAAAVIINTSGHLQQRAANTGLEATNEVSGNLRVERAYGERDYTNGLLGNNIDNLTLMMRLNAGAVPMDMTQLFIRYSDGDGERALYWTADGKDDVYASTFQDAFRIELVNDPLGGYDPDHPVATTGMLFKIVIHRVSLMPNEDVSLKLIPERGASVSLDFRVPPAFGPQREIRIV